MKEIREQIEKQEAKEKELNTRREDLEKQLQGGMQQPAFPIILQCPIPHSF